jgi:hypothetical protein
MAEVKLTAARLDLLKAVAAGNVKHCTRSNPSNDHDYLRTEEGGSKKVTKSVEWLYAAGLIAKGSKEHASFFASAPWLLTEAGEHYLNTYA